MRRADAWRVAVPVPYIRIHGVRQRYAGQRGAYPELFALLGNSVPDLRGLFLRGYGGKSAALGATQDQATASSGIQIATAFIDLGGG